MNQDLWRDFAVLAEKLNFSETSKQLFLSQSVLSRHIAELESYLGVPLFIRSHQNVKLTEYGTAIFPMVKDMISTHGMIREKIENMQSAVKGSLRIAYIFDVMSGSIGQAVEGFIKEYPDVQLLFTPLNAVSTVENIWNKDPLIDVICNYICEPLSSEIYRFRKLFYEPLALILPPDHELSGRRSVCLSEIQDEPFIECSPDQNDYYRRMIENAIESAGGTCRARAAANSLKQAMIMVEAHQGITIVPWRDGRYTTYGIVAVPLSDPSCQIPFGAIWRKSSLNENIENMIPHLQHSLTYKS